MHNHMFLPMGGSATDVFEHGHHVSTPVTGTGCHNYSHHRQRRTLQAISRFKKLDYDAGRMIGPKMHITGGPISKGRRVYAGDAHAHWCCDDAPDAGHGEFLADLGATSSRPTLNNTREEIARGG
jgi:hypothetical protein